LTWSIKLGNGEQVFSSTIADVAMPSFDHRRQICIFTLRTVVWALDSVEAARFRPGGELDADALE
jgi:hypothetical protein